MCSQINHSFMRKREEDLQFPSYLECYSELHILPRSSDAVGSGSATGLMCLNHSSISIPCPSRRDPGRLSPAALTEQGPDSTEHSQSYSLVKAAHSSVGDGCIQAMVAAGWRFWQELPTGALVLCQCNWFKVTLPGKLYPWNTDTCPPGKSVKTRVPIIWA